MRFVCVALVLGFVVVQTAAAQDSRDRLQHIDSLIAVSSAPSFGHTLQALGAVIVLCQARPPALAAQQALRALCERSFALDSSRVHMRTAFEGRYNPGQFDLLIAWFRSPLGRKVIGAERSAAELKEDQRRQVREKVRSQWVSSRRLLLLERLDGNLGYGFLQKTYALALLEDLIAPPTSTGQTERPSDAQVQRMLLDATGRLEARLPDSLMLDMKVAYRSVSNDELQRYNEFLESSGGRWYVQMLHQGLENAFLSGRQRFVGGAMAMPASTRKVYVP